MQHTNRQQRSNAIVNVLRQTEIWKTRWYSRTLVTNRWLNGVVNDDAFGMWVREWFDSVIVVIEPGDPWWSSIHWAVTGPERWRKNSARKAVSIERTHISANDERSSRIPLHSQLEQIVVVLNGFFEPELVFGVEINCMNCDSLVGLGWCWYDEFCWCW